MRTTNAILRWTELAGFTLAFAALILFQSDTLAQTPEATKPTTEIEQLKQRLQQLEQTVLELKGQITAVEETKKKNPTSAIVEATYSDSALLKFMVLRCWMLVISSSKTILIGLT